MAEIKPAAAKPAAPPASGEDVARAKKLLESYAKITGELGKLVVGQEDVIEQLLIAHAIQRSGPMPHPLPVSRPASSAEASSSPVVRDRDTINRGRRPEGARGGPGACAA